jgi:hypothetical protein
MAYIKIDIDKVSLFSFRVMTEEDCKIMKAIIHNSDRDVRLPDPNLFVFNRTGSFIFKYENVGTILSTATMIDSEIPRKIAVRATITGNLRESIIQVISQVEDVSPYVRQRSIFNDNML